MTYHMLMARREVLVQLDDDTVRDLDRLARGAGANRSELIRRAVQALLQVEDGVTGDRALVEAYRRLPPDEGLAHAATRLAAETAPEW